MMRAAADSFPGILGYWVHDLNPVLVEFTETLAIRYYGLAYVLGFVVAWGVFVLAERRGRSPLQSGELENLISYLFFGVVIGGRLGYVLLYQTDSLWKDPLYILRVWEGGMASHGGFLGVIVAVLLFARRYRHNVFQIADLMAIAAPPGLFLGRCANFINGELWGKVTDVSWAVIFPAAQTYPHFNPSAFTVYSEELDRIVNPRHPSQLYAAALEGLLLGLYLHARFWGTDRFRRVPGQIAGEFFVVYGLLRIVGEVFREPDSLFTILGGIVLIAVARHFAARNRLAT